MGETQIERQPGKDKDSITKILASRQKLKSYEADHLTTVETKKKPGIARMLHDLFLENIIHLRGQGLR